MDFKIMFSEYMTVYLLEKSFRHKLADTRYWMLDRRNSYNTLRSIQYPASVCPEALTLELPAEVITPKFFSQRPQNHSYARRLWLPPCFFALYMA